MSPSYARAIRLSYRLFPSEPARVTLHHRPRFSLRFSLLWEREWAGII